MPDLVWQSPGWLWLLLAVPLAAVAYALWARRAARTARAWADPAVMAVAAAPRARRWRTAAVALALLAFAAAVVATARPSTYATEEERRSVVMLTVDVSASMNRTDLAPDRMTAAIDAANRFLDAVPDGTQVGLVTFARGARVVVAPTRAHDRVRAAVDGLATVRGRTALGEALITSLGALRAAGAVAAAPLAPGAAPGRVLLLTDGIDTAPNAATPQQAAERAAAAGVPIYSILLGDDRGDEARGSATPAETLSALSTRTGGVFAQGATTPDLVAVLDDLGSIVAPVERLREHSAWPAGAALVLLLLAGAALAAGRAPHGLPAPGRRDAADPS